MRDFLLFQSYPNRRILGTTFGCAAVMEWVLSATLSAFRFFRLSFLLPLRGFLRPPLAVVFCPLFLFFFYGFNK